MKANKKIAICALAALLLTAMTGCDEEQTANIGGSSPSAGMTSATTTAEDPDLDAPTDAKIKEIGTEAYTPDGNSGKITWLGYYDLKDDGSSAEQYKIFTSELYGGGSCSCCCSRCW